MSSYKLIEDIRDPEDLTHRKKLNCVRDAVTGLPGAVCCRLGRDSNSGKLIADILLRVFQVFPICCKYVSDIVHK